jgi:hypothetical protein
MVKNTATTGLYTEAAAVVVCAHPQAMSLICAFHFFLTNVYVIYLGGTLVHRAVQRILKGGFLSTYPEIFHGFHVPWPFASKDRLSSSPES